MPEDKKQAFNSTVFVLELLDDKAFSDGLIFIKDIASLARLQNDGYFRIEDEEEIYRHIWRRVQVEHRGKATPPNFIRDVYKQLTYGCPARFDTEDKTYIAFKDGYFNTLTFQLEPKRTDLPVTFFMPFNYADLDKEPAPIFNNYLETTLVDENDPTLHDPELAALLQEIFGYCLLSTTTAEAAFFLVGEGANGKSVATSILEAMVGSQFCSAMSLETLTTRPFATAHLVAKRLNISNEEESKYMKTDKFKQLVSGNSITAERKFGATFEFGPSAKYVFCSNVMPTFGDLVYGTRRRIIIVPFSRVFKNGERDHALRQRLLTELPAIISWSLKGAERLVKHDYFFSESSASAKAAIEHESESSSAFRYLRESYQSEGERFFICSDAIYESYTAWCKSRNKKPVNYYNFIRSIPISGVADKNHGDNRAFCPAHQKRHRGFLLSPATDEAKPKDIDNIPFGV